MDRVDGNFLNTAIMSEKSALVELRQTIARLRGPGGCPWDQEQTHASLARCLIDECSELLETIDRLDMPHMREELGDVLIQVIFHAQLAEERGLFDLEDVAREVNEKLIRRHPHVFGENRLENSEQVLVQWDAIKATEKGATKKSERLFKELPPRLPALMFAESVWKQIEKKSLSTGETVDAASISKQADQLDEAELGKRLFELAAAARARNLDAEGALRLYAVRVMDEVEARVASGKQR